MKTDKEIKINDYKYKVKNWFNTNYDSHDVWSFIKLTFDIYPNMMIFLITCLTIGILLPLIGSILCFYRCCSSNRYDPYDNKHDSLIRKLFTIILFLFMMILLIALIVLFFTNQNSFKAINETPNIAEKSYKAVNSYIKTDIPPFFTYILSKFDAIETNFNKILETTVDNLTGSFLTEINNFIKDLNGVIINEVTKTNNKIDKINDDFTLIQQKKAEINDNLKEMKISNQIFPNKDNSNQETFFIQKIEFKDVEDSLTKNINDAITMPINQYKIKIKKNINREAIKSLNHWRNASEDMFDKFLLFINDNNDIKNNKNDTKLLPNEFKNKLDSIIKYYKYFYYILIGVCAFMMGLFVLYSCGIAGIFANKQYHELSFNYNDQKCSRGAAANLLLSATGLYIIFSILIIFLCILMLLPGAIVRQLACKPSIELDDNEIFQYFKNIDFDNSIINESTDTLTFSNINFKQLVNECRVQKRSLQSKELINIFMPSQFNPHRDESVTTIRDFITDKSLTSLNDKKIEIPKIPNFDESINKTLSRYSFNKFNTVYIQKQRDDLKKKRLILSQLTNNEDEAFIELNNNLDVIDSTLASLNEKITNLIDYQQETLKTIHLEVDTTIKTISQLDNFKLKVEKSLEIVLNSYTIPATVVSLIKIYDSILDNLPSCEIVAFLYDMIVVTSCYEFLDNFNTYWAALLVCYIIHLIVVIFSVRQADLFRKYYSFDENLTDEVYVLVFLKISLNLKDSFNICLYFFY
jgi:hypothetical protein